MVLAAVSLVGLVTFGIILRSLLEWEELAVDALYVEYKKYLLLCFFRKRIPVVDIRAVDIKETATSLKDQYSSHAGLEVTWNNGSILFARGASDWLLCVWASNLRECIERYTSKCLDPAPVLTVTLIQRDARKAEGVQKLTGAAPTSVPKADVCTRRRALYALALTCVGTVGLGLGLHLLLDLENPIIHGLRTFYLFNPGLGLGGVGPWFFIDILLPGCLAGIYLSRAVGADAPYGFGVNTSVGFTISLLTMVYPHIVSYPQWWMLSLPHVIVFFTMNGAMASAACYLAQRTMRESGRLRDKTGDLNKR
jgi:hypothetical protein